MTVSAPDHYEVLGVSRTSTTDEIKVAYRSLARATHPDVGGNAALFRIISEAHETLTDPQARAEYDRRSAGRGDSTPSAPQNEAWEPDAGDGSGEPRNANWWSRIDPTIKRTALATLIGNALLIWLDRETVVLLVCLASGAFLTLKATPSEWAWWQRAVALPVISAALFAGSLAFFMLAMLLVAILIMVVVLAFVFPQGTGIGRVLGLLRGPRPKPGEIWFADFPFEEDAAESKDRPCLVLATTADKGFVTCKITSVDHSNRPGYHPVTPAVTGLPKLSYLRVTPTVTLDRKQFRRAVGEADPVLWAWAAQKNAAVL